MMTNNFNNGVEILTQESKIYGSESCAKETSNNYWKCFGVNVHEKGDPIWHNGAY